MLSWHEIRDRAVTFAHEWEGETKESAEYQGFWNEFFEVFGIKRRSVALYQKKIEKITGNPGYIDLFWPGELIVEHKSAGEDLDAAFKQAGSYFDRLSEEEKPRRIIVTDYQRIRFYDLEAENGIEEIEFALQDFSKHVRQFAFIAGYQKRSFKEEDPINTKAVRAIGRLYEAIKSSNYSPEHVSPLLTRLVFCFFADDIGIFDRDTFKIYLEEKTREDGADIGAQLSAFFQTLNTDTTKRQTTLDDDLASLPYVNGGMFAESIPVLFGTSDMRKALIHACSFDWSAVSPAIFGSMFQSIMSDEERHALGAHYTSEKNILKVISGLFLDDLKQKLESAKTNEAKLRELWNELERITLLDPACGCGNFLVVAYRELRALELEIIKRLHNKKGGYAEEVEGGQGVLGMGFNIKTLSKLSVERMFGIEIEAFPAQVAKLSLWVTDHMANIELGNAFGKPFQKLPLTEQPHIVQGNALTLNWEDIVPKDKLTHILGNPPFIGSKVMTQQQRNEIKTLFNNATGSGVLDYVTGWYIKAAQYMDRTPITAAFVSTNSITQGEQVGILWRELEPFDLHIRFAHRTFKWTNEAPGKAAVYCVIIGFGTQPAEQPKIYEYQELNGEPHEVLAHNINAYLVDAPNVYITSRSKPLCDVPEIGIGNKPIDGGMYLFTDQEKAAFLQKEPQAEKYFKRWLGADEFLNGWQRWCLWLGNADPAELKKMPEALRRVQAVREYRLASSSVPTNKLAETPTRFHVENMPKQNYLVIPETSSESRRYIPIGFLGPDTIVSNAMKVMSEGSLYHFGILESEMHMTWMRAVCGRLESRYRYSKDIVYNNFPWPQNVSSENKKKVEGAAQAVLDARAQFPNATLADLYSPNTMPKALLDAHKALDRVVDSCYGKRGFATEAERLEFLFAEYQKLISYK